MEIHEQNMREREKEQNILNETRLILQQTYINSIDRLIPFLSPAASDYQDIISPTNIPVPSPTASENVSLLGPSVRTEVARIEANMISEPKTKATPKKFSKPNTEADDEPEQTRGRSRTRTNKEKEREKEDKKSSVKKTIKKDIKQERPKHETYFINNLTLQELKKKGRGFLVDQIHKRPGIKFTPTNAKRMSIEKMAQEIFNFDRRK